MAEAEPVFILEDPEGTPWVMQAFGADHRQITHLRHAQGPRRQAEAAGRMKFRVAVLDKELTISTPQGYNWIVQDELQNTYAACKEAARNFKP